MKKIIFPILVLLITSGIFFLSLQDASTSNALSSFITQKLLALFSFFDSSRLPLSNHLIREVAHIVEFFLLSFGLMGILYRFHLRLRTCTHLTILYTSIIALIDESIQFYYSPGRAFEFIDLLKDCLGMSLAIGTFFIFFRVYKYFFIIFRLNKKN